MSDIFESDIYEENEDLASLEDSQESESTDSRNFVFPKNFTSLSWCIHLKGFTPRFPAES